jgi:hypothetical protein
VFEDPAKLLIIFQDIITASVVESKPVVMLIVGALAVTYTCTVAVALFHPDGQRRADARSLLLHHRLTRALRKRGS